MPRPTQPPRCALCGEPMLASSEQFYVCPRAHGPLVPRKDGDAEVIARERRDFERRADRAFGKKTG